MSYLAHFSALNIDIDPPSEAGWSWSTLPTSLKDWFSSRYLLDCDASEALTDELFAQVLIDLSGHLQMSISSQVLNQWLRYDRLPSLGFLADLCHGAIAWQKSAPTLPIDVETVWKQCREQWLYLHQASGHQGVVQLLALKDIPIAEWMWLYLSMDDNGLPQANGYSFGGFIRMTHMGEAMFLEGLERLRQFNALGTLFMRLDAVVGPRPSFQLIDGLLDVYDLGWDLPDARLPPGLSSWVARVSSGFKDLVARDDGRGAIPWAPLLDVAHLGEMPVMRQLALLVCWGSYVVGYERFCVTASELLNALERGAICYPSQLLNLRHTPLCRWPQSTPVAHPPVCSWQTFAPRCMVSLHHQELAMLDDAYAKVFRDELMRLTAN